MKKLTQKLKTLPPKPGVYLFKNAQGEVLYIGKAKNLKNRVRTYFHPPHPLLGQVEDLDYIIVSSEIESLILENNLIKQYQPRFNVRLRDDKNYQFIKIDYEQEIPQIYPVRRIEPGAKNPKSKISNLKSKYFGPYTSATSVKNTLKLIRRIFHLCTNKKVSAKPCFQYHLGRCPGVCIGQISINQYKQTLQQVEQFLKNEQTAVIKALRGKMHQASQTRQFEKAALMRDKIRSLENIWQKQKIVSTQKTSQDYFSLWMATARAVVNLFMVREGKLIHQEFFELAQTQNTAEAQVMESFLKQYYAEASNPPKEIMVRYHLPDQSAIEKWLRVKIAVPQRGRKLGLLKLGEENAEDYYQKTFSSFEKVLGRLQLLLNLSNPPRRIEAYDISNIQGFLPVGSMVVFEGGQPKKSDYRKFKIKSRTLSAEGLPKADDVAMMREMLERRFKHSPVILEGRSPDRIPKEDSIVRQGGLQNDNSYQWPLPDLIVIDGGRGQLNAALSVIRNSKFDIPVIGLAKRLEEIFIPGKKHSIRLREDSPVLHLLQRIRDEAHRFAITFYRQRHRKQLTN